MAGIDSIHEVDCNGNVIWRNADGKIHRADGPAREYANGAKFWYSNGIIQRIDGPAIVHADGRNQEWKWNGKLHRLNGPAVVGMYTWWYVDGNEVDRDAFEDVAAQYCQDNPECPSVIQWLQANGRTRKPARAT